MAQLNRDNDNIRTAVASWIAGRAQLLSPLEPATVHIDELFSDQHEDELDLSIFVFARAVEIVRNLNDFAKLLLVIPLLTISSEAVMASPSTISELRGQLDNYESPSLYLVDWRASKSVAPCQEYCTPLLFALLADDIPVYTYYREFRYELARSNNWEFSRAVYLEYYPNGLIAQ